MGRHSEEFEKLVTGIVCGHAELWPGEAVSSMASKAGNYLSVTAVINALSQQQLDTIYQELTDCEQVLFAL
jgi:putative lipoic acid-binding regulatory protein